MHIKTSFERIRPGYILRPRGKNLRFTYLTRCALRSLTPKWWLRHRYDELLASLEARPDRDEILARVDYCNKLNEIRPITGQMKNGGIRNNTGGGNYHRDYFEYGRFFRPDLLVDTAFGDNTAVAATPSIVKSRPIAGANANDVLLNLDKVRHFTFLKDKLQFTEKTDGAIFRGAAYQPHRRRFMEQFFGNPLIDCADTSGHKDLPQTWQSSLITLYDHLRYKFVICLEGNDVASNLKWVMSSNSLAVMPKPKYETWFLEGWLKPGVHYVEIRDDYADLEEKIHWYAARPKDAQAILDNAHAHVARFQDQDREDLISLLVLKKYFEMTGQTI